MADTLNCEKCRFRCGCGTTLAEARAAAKLLRKRHAAASRAIAAVTLVFAAALLYSSSALIEAVAANAAVTHTVPTALAILSDFTVMLVISAGAGAEICLFTHGNVTLGDIPRLILAVLPHISLVYVAALECVLCASFMSGLTLALSIAVIIILALRELERLALYPSLVLLTELNSAEAKRVSRLIYVSERGIIRKTVSSFVLHSAAAALTFSLSAVFAAPLLFSRYAAVSDIIIKDYKNLTERKSSKSTNIPKDKAGGFPSRIISENTAEQ